MKKTETRHSRWLALSMASAKGTASASGTDRSEIGPYLGGLRATAQSPATNSASPTHFRGRAISPKAPLRRRGTRYVTLDGRRSRWHALSLASATGTASASGTDRSEIGPYLGGLRATAQGPATNSASPAHFRGRAISPKAPLRRRGPRDVTLDGTHSRWPKSGSPAAYGFRSNHAFSSAISSGFRRRFGGM